MAEATAYVTTVRNEQSSQAMSKAYNFDFRLITNSWALDQTPSAYVYMFNLAHAEYKFERPPLLKEARIAACPDGQDVIMWTSLPQPMKMPKANVDSGELDIIPFDARKFAMDICNPDNTSLNQDAVIAPEAITAEGNNLGAKGVFWVLGPANPDGTPLSEEQAKQLPDFAREKANAKKRLENYYKNQLSKARAMEVSNPAALGQFIGPDHHAAADWFGEEHPNWHARKAQMDFCPLCGERMKAGAAFHKTEEGTLCINDWVRAVKAGVRTRAQAYDATGDEQFAPKSPTVEVSNLHPKPNTKVPQE